MRPDDGALRPRRNTTPARLHTVCATQTGVLDQKARSSQLIHCNKSVSGMAITNSPLPLRSRGSDLKCLLALALARLHCRLNLLVPPDSLPSRLFLPAAS